MPYGCVIFLKKNLPRYFQKKQTYADISKKKKNLPRYFQKKTKLPEYQYKKKIYPGLSKNV